MEQKQTEAEKVAEAHMKANNAGPDVTPDCCPQWKAFAPLFDWYHFADFPGLACMPNVRATAPDSNGIIHKWRVQFCPACGAERRNVIMWVEDLT